MGSSREILVVGGGVIGLCTAYYAAQRGHRVTVLERGGPDHDGCSLGNAGMVVPSHFIPLAAPGMVSMGLRMMFDARSPFYIRPRLDPELFGWAWRFWRASNRRQVQRAAPLLLDLSLASRRGFEELAGLPGNDFGFCQKGLLMLCKTEHALEEESKVAEMARRLGLPAETLDAAGAAALEPGARMDIAGAVYFPQDCHLSPQLFVAGLTRHLQAAGIQFRWNTEVTGWQARAGRVTSVRTSQGDISADVYVVASGAWSPQIVRDLGIRLPMQAGKGYSVTLPQPRQKPVLCSILTEARVAVTPMPSGLRVGGTMEIAGLDQSINPLRVQGIIQALPRYYPEFRPEDFQELPVWRGLRPCSPDGLPYVGRFARYSNLIAATGHAMLGLSLGPATGQVVSELISEGKPSLDVELLSPDRYNS